MAIELHNQPSIDRNIGFNAGIQKSDDGMTSDLEQKLRGMEKGTTTGAKDVAETLQNAKQHLTTNQPKSDQIQGSSTSQPGKMARMVGVAKECIQFYSDANAFNRKTQLDILDTYGVPSEQLLMEFNNNMALNQDVLGDMVQNPSSKAMNVTRFVGLVTLTPTLIASEKTPIGKVNACLGAAMGAVLINSGASADFANYGALVTKEGLNSINQIVSNVASKVSSGVAWLFGSSY